MSKKNKITLLQWVRFQFAFNNLLKHCDNEKILSLSNRLDKEKKKRGL